MTQKTEILENLVVEFSRIWQLALYELGWKEKIISWTIWNFNLADDQLEDEEKPGKVKRLLEEQTDQVNWINNFFFRSSKR